MSTAVEGMSSLELVNLERLALELLVDEDALRGIRTALNELDEGEGIPLDEW